jgi:hypothetical protein
MRFSGSNPTLELLAFLGVLGWMMYGSSQSFKKAQRKKEMEHAERMKLIEMGLVPDPPSGLDWPAATVCIAIGAGVPIGSFLVAWLASLTTQVPSQIWVAPVFVSFAAIGATRKLAFRMMSGQGKTWFEVATRSAKPAWKEAFDSEAFEPVESRR